MGSPKKRSEREKFVLPVGAMTSAPARVVNLPACRVSGPADVLGIALEQVERIGARARALGVIDDLGVLAGDHVHHGAEPRLRLIGELQSRLIELEGIVRGIELVISVVARGVVVGRRHVAGLRDPGVGQHCDRCGERRAGSALRRRARRRRRQPAPLMWIRCNKGFCMGAPMVVEGCRWAGSSSIPHAKLVLREQSSCYVCRGHRRPGPLHHSGAAPRRAPPNRVRRSHAAHRCRPASRRAVAGVILFLRRQFSPTCFSDTTNELRCENPSGIHQSRAGLSLDGDGGALCVPRIPGAARADRLSRSSPGEPWCYRFIERSWPPPPSRSCC